MDINALCFCGHRRHQHRTGGGACAYWGCDCNGFEDEVVRSRRRRGSDEQERRIRVLRQHLIPVIQDAQDEGLAPKGDQVTITLLDRVQSFVLRSGASTCEPKQLEEELVRVLSQPMDGPSGVPGDTVFVAFPRALAKDLLDAIVLAAHKAHDTMFQEAS